MTAIWRSREKLVHQLVMLAGDRLSKRAIAWAVGVSRNTVKVVLAAHAGKRAERAVLPGRPTGRGTNTRPGSSGIRIQTPSRVDHHRAAVAPLAWIHAGAEMDQSKGDPFDRLLIAQALDQGYTIVSHDGAFDAFGVPVLRA